MKRSIQKCDEYIKNYRERKCKDISEFMQEGFTEDEARYIDVMIIEKLRRRVKRKAFLQLFLGIFIVCTSSFLLFRSDDYNFFDISMLIAGFVFIILILPVILTKGWNRVNYYYDD
jgi:hypothetical protein